MVDANWALVLVTLALVVVTLLYVHYTKQIAEKTAETARIAEKSARYTAAVELTRLSIEQNWRLWEAREVIRPSVAPEGLTEEDWAERLPLLNHLNLLLLAWRGHELGVVDQEELDSWVSKAKLNMSKVREKPVALRQLQILFRRGEGYPDGFRRWMFERGILREEDGV